MTLVEQVAAVLAADAEFQSGDLTPYMRACPRCGGRGYHHGFGEDGHDPDWCSSCGGVQIELDEEAYQAARVAFIVEQVARGRG